MQGYWRFENNLNDSSSRGYNLTHAGTPAYATGQFGYGLDAEVSTANQYAYIADASCPNLEIAGNQTWSAWIKLETGGRTNLIMSKLGANGTKQLYVNSSNKLVFQLEGLGSNTAVTGNITLATGVWYNVVGRYNSSNLQVFVNGVLDNTVVSTGSAADSNGDFRVCSNTTSSGFDGIIDDVAIWNRALTDAEVLGLYTGGQDLRFSSDASGTTQLAHEVVNWDIVNDKAEVWVKIPTLSYTTDTEIYVWYDNDTIAPQARNDTYGSYSVWSSFRLVTHDMLHDSTSNQYKGTAYNGASETTGLVGVGIDYGSDDYVSYGSQIPCLGNGDFTVETWINIDTLRDWSDIFMQQSSTPTSTGGTYGIDYTSAGKVFSWAYNLSLNTPSTNAVLSTSAGWQQVVATFNHTTKVAKVYVNGVEAVSETFSNTWTFTPAHTAFSCRYLGTGDQRVGTNDGQQDETKIANSLLSDGWIATEYNNQNSPSTFVTEGTPESATSTTTSTSTSTSSSTSSSSSSSTSTTTSTTSSSTSTSTSTSSSSSSSTSTSSTTTPEGTTTSSSTSTSTSTSSSTSTSTSSSSTTTAYISDRYWIGGTGNWSDTDNWSYTSGGSGGAPVPTSSDDVFIDENSGFGGGGTLTLDKDAFCKDFTCTSGDTYTIEGDTTSDDLNVYGSFELESGITWGVRSLFFWGCGDNTITTNGVVLKLVYIGAPSA